MDYVVTLVLLFITTVLMMMWTKSRRDKKWPPGPPTVPFIGNLNLDMTDRLEMFRKLRQQYGDIYSLILGSQTVVVVNGLDTLKELFVKHGDVVSVRPDNFIFRDINNHQGIVGSSGALWKEHRTFALSTMRDFGFGKRSMESKIIEEVEVFLNCVKDTKGVAFNISDLLHISTSNIICSVVFGNRYEHTDEKFIELLNIVSENLNNSQLVGLLTFLPFLRYLPGDLFSYKRVMNNADKVLGFMQNKIDERKAKHPEEDPSSYLDAYIKHQREKCDTDSTFTDKQLQFAIADIFVAGSESTATSVRWFILFMLHKQEIQQRMRKEILDVIGDSRLPSLSDKEKLPYCDAVLHETLRCGNLAPLSAPHGLTRDLEFRGFIIPKDAMLLPCLDSVLNDPDIFENPSEFNPGRFITEDGSVTGLHKVDTFGIGPRKCMGEAMARMEFFLFATSLIQRFQLIPPDDATLPSMTESKLGLTHLPLPFTFRAVPCE